MGFIGRQRDRVYEHRARWAARILIPWVRPGDRVLDIGAGDCRVDVVLKAKIACEVTPVDILDYNRTNLPLTIFDGKRLPFADDSFDVGLFLFVLHHVEDVDACLAEARRVCRRHVIAFEDLNVTWWDRRTFRGFHIWLDWAEKIDKPFREWTPSQWTDLATRTGLREVWQQPLGRSLGPIASRHVGFVWEKPILSAKAA